tara:strand:+ start:18635 stop:19660 length:1026 start_codon:yes stop_codon:yes gene_type:complete
MYKTSLIITTINKPNQNMRMYDKGCEKNKWDFIVVGDKKTPSNYKLSRAKFLSYRKTLENISFSKKCPLNTYARKNIGYLYAIKKKTKIIVETDDDNAPLKNFFSTISFFSNSQTIEKKKDWINIYNYFSKKKDFNKIWPRGLPLEKIKKDKKEKIINRQIKESLIIQSLCNGNPDVDAIFRLMNSEKKNIKFINNRKYFISNKSYVPFNSQSTIWHRDAFPLLYLPVTCTFRSTDIWRSLIAQIILNNDNKLILFQSPTVFQKRNKHDLLKDFESEVPVYLENQKIIKILTNTKLKKGPKNYLSNLYRCYESLVKNGILVKKELSYIDLWVKDYKKLNTK